MVEIEKTTWEALPKTADGVVVVPGMRVWGPIDGNNWEIDGVVLSKDENCVSVSKGFHCELRDVNKKWSQQIEIERCYSTREASRVANSVPGTLA